MRCVSVDIGSTYTKGALFVFENGSLRLLGRAGTLTTREDLSAGFLTCIDTLEAQCGTGRGRAGKAGGLLGSGVPVLISSSARGGLSIAAVGLVPSVTMKMAKSTAISAGGRVTRAFSYKLTGEDIMNLESDPPDILLFAGGTDGGDEIYARHNARMLASSSLSSSIIFCGNRAMKEEVGSILAGKELSLAANILPELDRPEPEEARAGIREIFLRKIVSGKGLDRVISLTGSEVMPTPLAMFEYVKLLGAHNPAWRNYCVIDMGGATTDFYSTLVDPSGTPGVVFRGLPEPASSRTVEGDLGMRINAHNLFDPAGDFLVDRARETGIPADAIRQYTEKLHRAPGSLPGSEREVLIEEILASACVATAAERHAGRRERIFTAGGEVLLLTGRDLSGVEKVIGTGGYLARMPGRFPAPRRVDERGREILLPVRAEYYLDSTYLFPLLANAARSYPRAAAACGISSLVRDES